MVGRLKQALALSPPVRVTVHQGGSGLALTDGAAELQVAEGPCTVVVSGLEPVSTVLLNDEPAPLVRTGRRDEGFLSLDLTNKVGFHRLTIRQRGVEQHFDFETTSAKATWLDIKAMASVVASQVFALQRQFLYSSVSGDRRAVWVPEVEFAWLRDRLSEIGALVERIDRAPAQESRRRFKTSNQARNVSVPHTLRLLREKRELLEQAEGGPLVVDGESYWPSAVRVREHEKEPARIEHASDEADARKRAQIVLDVDYQPGGEMTRVIGPRFGLYL